MVPLRSGLKPLTPDIRDRRFLHSKLFGAPDLSQLPPSGLSRIPGKIKNQFATQFCTAFATSSASEYQEGVELSPEYQAAKIGFMNGEPIVNGSDPRMALKAAIAFGSLEAKDVPEHMKLTQMNAPSVADWTQWPTSLDEKAKEHMKRAFIPIDRAGLDTFDAIKWALWCGRNEEQAVIAMGRWYSFWNAVGQDGIVQHNQYSPYGLHAYLFIDWTMIDGRDYLVCQNSYGEGFGDDGLQYFSREIINAVWGAIGRDGTGLFIYRDVDSTTVDALREQQLSLYEILLDWYYRLIFRLQYGFFS